MTRPLRIALIAIAAVVAIVAGAVTITLLSFDPNVYKPDIVQAVKRATGRDITLNGSISLKPSLWPTLQVADVSFSNPPGFSRPAMATLQRLEVQLGLLPLLSRRIEIDRIVLVQPDILLERDAAGQPNWQFTPEALPPAPAGSEATVKTEHTTTAISIDAVRIQDGTVGYRDDRGGTVINVGVKKLDASADSPDAPLHLAADLLYRGTGMSVVADTGALTRLRDRGATSAWPVKLALTVADAKLNADGTMTQPLLGRGYDLAVSGAVPDATVLTPVLGGYVPPPLHDVQFAAKLKDTGARLPDVSTLTLHVGASDLGAVVPGLLLDKLDIEAPAADQPIKVDAAARLGDAPVTVTGLFGAPAVLLPGAAVAPFPVDVTVRAGGATASAKGTIGDGQALSGADIALAAQIPDLSALSPLARRPLPALKAVAFAGTLTDAYGGLRQGVALHGARLTGAEGDLSGDIAVALGVRPALTANLRSDRIDLDGWQAAIDAMPVVAAPVGPAGPPPPAERPRGDRRLFSERPIPFDLLRAADGDVTFSSALVRSGGEDFKANTAHAILSNGKLTVDPFAADLPAGPLKGSLSVDATQPAAAVHLVLHAPGLAMQSVLAALHEPRYATGDVEVNADLSGTGDSPHAIASSLDGSLGLAMTGGTLDNRLLGSLLGKVEDALNTLNLVGRGGSSSVKCFALRMDARNGVGAIKPIALSSSLLTMTGMGTINLGSETVAMALRPEARFAGTGLTIPIAVSGPIRDPSVKVNDVGAAEANVATIAGVVLGDATPLGIVGGLFGADKLFGGKGDICGPALAMARGEKVPEQSKSERPEALDPARFLQKLFR